MVLNDRERERDSRQMRVATMEGMIRKALSEGNHSSYISPIHPFVQHANQAKTLRSNRCLCGLTPSGPLAQTVARRRVRASCRHSPLKNILQLLATAAAAWAILLLTYTKERRTNKINTRVVENTKKLDAFPVHERMSKRELNATQRNG